MKLIDKLIIVFAITLFGIMSAVWSFSAATTKIQIRRGAAAQLPGSFAMGEPAMTTDTHQFFIGYSTGKEEMLKRARFLGYTASQAVRLAAIWDSLAAKASLVDPRFSDARNPLSHYQNISTIRGLQTILDSKAAQSALSQYVDNILFSRYTSLHKGVTGLQGPKGDKGDTGLTGVAGAQGAQGIQGPQGIQGLQGIQGPQGERGYRGFSGLPGRDGATGAQGIQGPAGSEANINPFLNHFSNYSAAIAAQLAGKEQSGIASGLIVSHNTLGSAHSGHFTASNPHSNSQAKDQFSLYSASRQAQLINLKATIAGKATLNNKAAFANLSAQYLVIKNLTGGHSYLRVDTPGEGTQAAVEWAKGGVSKWIWYVPENSSDLAFYSPLSGLIGNMTLSGFDFNGRLTASTYISTPSIRIGSLSANTSDVINHITDHTNPHVVVAAQVFGNHTGHKYPVFAPDNSYVWTNPVEVCGANPANSIYDGATGPPGPIGSTLTCWIASTVVSINYDANGSNPLPVLQPFYPYLLKNATQVNPSSITWSVPTTNTLLSGSGSGASFTPSLFGTYSARKGNNWVSVMLNYSGKSCRATLPLGVTRTGATGATGAAGGNVNVTEQTITDAMAFQQSNHSLNLYTATGEDTVKFKVWNISNQLSLWITGKGRIVVQDSNGFYRWQFDPAVMQMLMKDNANVTRIVAGANDGSVTGYRGNGTTKAFQLWSSGAIF